MEKKVKTQTHNGFNVLIWQEDDLFVAKTAEIELASQGKTKKEALENLQEALDLYFENEKISPSSVTPFNGLELHKIQYPKTRHQYA